MPGPARRDGHDPASDSPPGSRVVAVVVATHPWALAPLAGRPLAAHCVAALRAAPAVGEVLVAAAPAVAGPLRAALGQPPRLVEAGGGRAQAVYQALQAIGDSECGVLVHDAAWPLVSPRVIGECAAALETSQAACAAVPASDTMVATEEDFITERPARDRLRRRQYPQGFGLPVILRAYRLALADPSFRPADDCGIVLRYLPEVTIRLVRGFEQAFAVTSPLDLDIARAVLGSAGPS